MPKSPVRKHQNRAPGPPRAMAVEIPTILPVPSVAASVVASVAKPPIPFSPFSFFLETEARMARKVSRWGNSRKVKKRCVAARSRIMGPFHKKAFIFSKKAKRKAAMHNLKILRITIIYRGKF